MAKKTGLSLDKSWEAREDARILAEAACIRNDPKRMKAAAVEAKKMADDKMVEAKAMKRIAAKAK